jgi:hypothetical protein
MKKRIELISLFMLVIYFVPAEANEHTCPASMPFIHEWNDDWSNCAFEGQKCSDNYNGRQCAPGLACESYAGRQDGICRRVCSIHRDCARGEFCDFKARGIGVCRSNKNRDGISRCTSRNRHKQPNWRY